MPRVHKRVFLFEPCLAAAPLPCTVLSGRILPRLAIGTCDKVIPLPRVFDAHTGALFSSNEASAGFFLRSCIHVVRTQPIAIMRHVTNDT